VTAHRGVEFSRGFGEHPGLTEHLPGRAMGAVGREEVKEPPGVETARICGVVDARGVGGILAVHGNATECTRSGALRSARLTDQAA
jgi:hypothetical protein